MFRNEGKISYENKNFEILKNHCSFSSPQYATAIQFSRPHYFCSAMNGYHDSVAVSSVLEDQLENLKR